MNTINKLKKIKESMVEKADEKKDNNKKVDLKVGDTASGNSFGKKVKGKITKIVDKKGVKVATLKVGDKDMKMPLSVLKRLKDIKESLKESTMLDGDQVDVLEAIVIRNKDKSDKEILALLQKDSLFDGLSLDDLAEAIIDTRLIYNFN